MLACEGDKGVNRRLREFRGATERDFIFPEEKKSQRTGGIAGEMFKVEIGGLGELRRKFYVKGLHRFNLA